jgi:hypothetical protein
LEGFGELREKEYALLHNLGVGFFQELLLQDWVQFLNQPGFIQQGERCVSFMVVL